MKWFKWSVVKNDDNFYVAKRGLFGIILADPLDTGVWSLKYEKWSRFKTLEAARNKCNVLNGNFTEV